MRRTKPAMTTAVLVAVIAATTVKAQQSNPSDSEPLGQSQPSGRTARAGQARPSPDDQVYGVAVTRGARYLMRNGLDYLNYREYDRALKFLREAETRKGELTKAEKQVLQNGIESAKADCAKLPVLNRRMHLANGHAIGTASARLKPKLISLKRLIPPGFRSCRQNPCVGYQAV